MKEGSDVTEQMSQPLRDLIEIIHFTENVAAKIHGALDEAEIYETVRQEFAKSERYTASILLLTDDDTKLRFAETSLSPGKVKAGEKVVRLGSYRNFKVDLRKTSFFRQVVKEGKTIEARFKDVVSEIFAKPLAYLISKTIGYEQRFGILTPLTRYGEITGVLIIDSTSLAEHFIPSVKNLARHISTALELAYENAQRRKTEEALRESDERLKQLIEYAPDAIYINDLQGNFIDGNKQAEALTGYKRDELIGKNFLKIGLLPKRYLPRASKALMENLLGRRTGPDEFEVVRKDGSRVTVEISSFPVKRAGKVEVIGIARDITERKRMEEDLARERDLLHALMDNIPDAIYFKDSASRFTRINRAHAQRIGLNDANQALGKTVFDFYPDEYAREAYADDQRILKTGRPLIDKVESIRTNDGHVRWSSTTKVPIMDKTGRTTGIVGISRDITERKRMEDDLKHYAEHLEELVEERTRKLREAERLAAIGETAAMVGHDLRNPLQVIVNTLYVAKKRLKSAPSSEEFAKEHGVDEVLGTIEEQVEYMNKIVSDLQDYARPLKPQLVQTSARQLIDETLSAVNVPETVEVSIEIEENFPSLMVDPAMMKRVLTNLVTNALQAMLDGGKLTVKAFKTDEATLISMRDTGVGIPKENMDRLFRPLFTSRARGTGLGLAISKRLVEAHNGVITVESEIGKGTVFTVKIPPQKEASQN